MQTFPKILIGFSKSVCMFTTVVLWGLANFQKVASKHIRKPLRICSLLPSNYDYQFKNKPEYDTSVLSPCCLTNYWMGSYRALEYTYQYTGDIQLYFSFLSSAGEAVDVLNQCLVAIMDWMRANALKLHPDKDWVAVSERSFYSAVLCAVCFRQGHTPSEEANSKSEGSPGSTAATWDTDAFPQLRVVAQLWHCMMWKTKRAWVQDWKFFSNK